MRSLAGAVLAVLTGLPVTAVVCAHKCSAASAAQTDAGGHCHEPGAAETATLDAASHGACDNPFVVTHVAARERTGNSHGDAPLVLPQLHDRASPHLPIEARPDNARPRRQAGGLPAGARLPLRI